MIRLVLVSLLVVSVVVIAGCTPREQRLPTFPVTGRVVYDGKPVANASLVFHAISAIGDAPKPRGKTDANGDFKLTTYDTEDGAPAGEYRVTVEQWLTLNPEEGPQNRLAPKFAKPESSGLTATVDGGQTTLKPIDLKK